MKLTKMIYIASPFTYKHQDSNMRMRVEEERFELVTKAIAKLQEKYPYAFIGPITQSHITSKYMSQKNSEFNYWRKRDLTYISRCDELWILPLEGWQESMGVQEEVKFAKKHKIPIRKLSLKLIENYI